MLSSMGQSLQHVELFQEYPKGQYWSLCSSSSTSMTVSSTAIDGNFTTLYAADMLLYRVINNAQDYTNLQQVVNNISAWVSNNNLATIKL